MLKEDHKGTNHRSNIGVKVHKVRGQGIIGYYPVIVTFDGSLDFHFTEKNKKKNCGKEHS